MGKAFEPPADLKDCKTPADIERVFQREIDKDLWECHFDLRKACNARAREIAGNFKRGHLLAGRLDKGRGCSRRYLVDGETYHTGSWGNGAGFRWAMASFEEWYEKKLRESGLRSDRKIQTIISWTTEGYLWRALRELV